MELVEIIQLTEGEGANLFTLVFKVGEKEIRWTTSSTKSKEELQEYLTQEMSKRKADKVCVVMKYVDKDGDICFVFSKDYCPSTNSEVVTFPTGALGENESAEQRALYIASDYGVENVVGVSASNFKVAYSTEGMTEDSITMVEVRVTDEDLENNPNLVVVKAKDLPQFVAENEFSTSVANYIEPYLQVMDLEDVPSVNNNGKKAVSVEVEKLTNERFLNKYKLTYTYEDGTKEEFYIVSRRSKENLEKFLMSEKNERNADTITVVPKYIDKDGDPCIIFIRERRFPVAGDVYSFPAGLVEPGEDAATSAARELAEEIGASKISELKPFKVGMSYNAVDMTEESVVMYEATIAEMKEQDLQDEEQIDIVIVKLKDLPEFVKGKTFSAKAAAYIEAYLKTLEHKQTLHSNKNGKNGGEGEITA